ncbi:hypothetical protein HPB50_025174 [Hyalomma asiaticum]|uniref:Uncharacterized protein n=1 Tax=Hyalomma asiaticum TaxID=266040 RepID=A0ACB7TNK6_HYAAI|nr:hypothetical protein HPB50_025174 [Hyalomma asiaticum]
MREKIKKYDLSLTVNSDGSPLFKSSKFSIWPVQVTINELPLHHRSKHVVTTTLWYGQSHPQMELLMGSFVRELEHLAQRGITWTDGTSSITSQPRWPGRVSFRGSLSGEKRSKSWEEAAGNKFRCYTRRLDNAVVGITFESVVLSLQSQALPNICAGSGAGTGSRSKLRNYVAKI